MDSLDVDVLGPLTITAGGTSVSPGGPLQRRLLAYLALNTRRPLAVDQLVAVLWPTGGPADTRATLHVYITHLRRRLEQPGSRARVLRGPAGYQLQMGEDELDLSRFDALLAEARSAIEASDRDRAAAQLKHARQLLRGQPFPDLRDVAEAGPELTELDDRIAEALQQSFELELALGHIAAVLPAVRREIAANPFREGLWATLILALYRGDRQEEALNACRDLRTLLRRELGIDPSPALQQLETDVRRQSRRLLDPPAAARPAARRYYDDVPVPLTRPLGRADDVERITDLLGGPSRMVTVTGPGGIGKTTVAQLVAMQLKPGFDDGACWVDLSTLSRADQVAAALAGALGLPEQAETDSLTRSCAFLRGRRLLLVFDNFEHVVGAWTVPTAILRAAPGVAVLVTSRQALKVRGETDYQLDPLPVPSEASPKQLSSVERTASVQLFMARARDANRKIVLTEENAAAITAICRHLDGMPLAIELAAARIRHHPPDALAAELDRVLEREAETLIDLPARQRTMAAALQWSYDLLDDEKRHLFDAMGAFAGQASTTALATVSGPSIDQTRMLRTVQNLRDCSMLRPANVTATADDPSTEVWVTMLQPVRDFARARLTGRPDAAAIRQRHAEFYAALAESSAPDLFTQNHQRALTALRDIGVELLHALEWATEILEHQRFSEDTAPAAIIALRLVGSLWHFWELTGETTRPCQLSDIAVAHIPDNSPRRTVAAALSGAATLHWLRGETEQSKELHTAALEAFRAADDETGVAWSLMCCAVQALASEDFPTSQSLAGQALSTSGADVRTRVGAWIVFGLLQMYESHPAQARGWFVKAVDAARTTDDPWLLGTALANLADCDEQLGQLAESALEVEELLVLSTSVDAHPLSVASVEILAAIELRRRRPERAARLFAAADNYRDEMMLQPTPPERARLDALLADVRTAAGPDNFAAAWTAGRRLAMQDLAREITIEQRSTRRPTLQIVPPSMS